MAPGGDRDAPQRGPMGQKWLKQLTLRLVRGSAPGPVAYQPWDLGPVVSPP